jgi:hypothetical protein
MSESNSVSSNSCTPTVPEDTYPKGLLVILSDAADSICLAV